jgi:hypothetical protein
VATLSASENILEAHRLRLEAARAQRLMREVTDVEIARRLERYGAAVERLAQRLERESRKEEGFYPTNRSREVGMPGSRRRDGSPQK